jgi:hypothetical protein
MVSVMTWLSIARQRVLNACQNVPICEDGMKKTPIGWSLMLPQLPLRDHDIPAHVTRTSLCLVPQLHMQDIHVPSSN